MSAMARKKLSHAKAQNAASGIYNLLDNTDHDDRLTVEDREYLTDAYARCQALAQRLWADDRAADARPD